MAVRQDLYTHVINNLRYGAAQDELAEALNECVERARETGKQAELTLTIKIKPNGNSGQYTLKDSIKQKLPEIDKGETLMFGTPEGNLQRDDPQQQGLDLRKVEAGEPEELRKVGE